MDTQSLCTKNNAYYAQHTDVVVYPELFKMRGGTLNKNNIFFLNTRAEGGGFESIL